MRRSDVLLATSREAPNSGTDVVALMQRAGLIRDFGSGLYGFLPTGERVRRKVTARIESAMDSLGGQRVSMPALQCSPIWEASGRWGNFDDEMFTLENRDGQAMCLAPSHEEGVAHLVDGHVRSHGDLPLLLYQVTEKYRDDHARNGLVRCKAFTMKDAYSLHASEESLAETYERVHAAYEQVFHDLGLDVAVVSADNSVMGGSESAEFVAPVESGSDDLVHCKGENCRFGVTDESARFVVYGDGDDCPDCGSPLVESEGIEVGHVFKLGTRYAEAMDLTVDTPVGQTTVVMGSYGIGVTRVVQTLVQQHLDGDDADSHAADGLRWPVTDWGTVAPYRAAIVPLDYEGDHGAVADDLYEALGEDDVLLFDDPGQQIGERFAESDLLGIPAKVVLGNHYDATGEVEIEYRSGRTESVDPDAVAARIADYTGNQE